MNRSEQEIVNLMADIELTVGKLYGVYAKKFPENAHFWDDIVKEEENHARLIRTLTAHLKKGEIRLDEARCNKGAVETVLNFVKGRLDLALKHAIRPVDAFFTALQIEKNVIENDFCSFFTGDSPEFKKACEIIAWETTQHRGKMKEMYDTYSGAKTGSECP
jgi:hypothetical protein